jgi:hypothetical protein
MTPTVGPRTLAAKNPADRYSWWTRYWLLWIALFFAGEIPALIAERRRQQTGQRDRVKRTFSANMRTVIATDSVTGIPLDVPYGKLRRLAGATAIMWFGRHISREGEM